MRKYLFLTPFIAAMIIFSGISCKTAPKPAEEPASPAQTVQKTEPSSGPDQALLNELSAAAARADEARKKAGDFEANTYFPGEWDTAEKSYSEAGSYSKATEADIRKAIAAYGAAADSYDSVFELAIPLYAQAREDEIMELRNILIFEGAKDSFPEYFVPADETALLALSQYENRDYYAARDTAAKTLSMYQILDTAWHAWNYRWEIRERDFILHDPDNYERAGEILSDAIDAYRADNLPLAMENAEESMMRYNLVLSTGWIAYAEERSLLAGNERLSALETKSNIAVKDYFTEADSMYVTALKLQKAENHAEAAKQFVSAEAMFVITSMTAIEKRKQAAAEIREANERIEASDTTARRAERIITGE